MKKLFQRFMLCTVVLSMLLINIQFPCFAYNTEFYFQNDFNSCVTYSAPDNMTVSAQQYYIEDDKENEDKHLKIITDNSSASAVFNLAASTKNLVISTEIEFQENMASMTFCLTDRSGNSFAAYKVSDDGSVSMFDGRKTGAMGIGKKAKITIVCDGNNKRYNVLIDGVNKLGSWYAGNQFPTQITSAKMEFSSNAKSNIIIDNLYVYDSDRILNDNELPKSVYNPKKTALSSDVFEEETGNSILMHSQFDSENYTEDTGNGFQLYPYSNIISYEYDDKSKNGYIKMERISGESCFIQIYSNATDSQVFQMDILSENLSGMSFMLTDKSNNKVNVMGIEEGGSILAGNKKIGNTNKKKWTNIAIGINAKRHIANYYVDNQLVLENLPFSDIIESISTLRVIAGSSNASIKLDNLFVYEGVKQRDFSAYLRGEIDKNEVLYDFKDSVIKGVMAGLTAIKPDTGYMYVDSNRVKSETMPYYDGDTLMVCSKDASKLLSNDINVSDGIISVGEKSLSSNGKSQDGTDFIPIETVANELGIITTRTDIGFITFGQKEYNGDIKALKRINAMLTYDRPDEETLNSLFIDEHPRLMINKKRIAEIQDSYKNNEYMRSLGDTVISLADISVKVEPIAWPGDDTRKLEYFRSMKNNIKILAMAFYLTDDKKYINRAWDEINRACSFPNWEKDENDLDSTMMTYGVAVGYDWLYDYWTDEQRKLMEEKLIEYELQPAYETYHGFRNMLWGWATVDTNWNSSCNGYVSMAACALYDKYPEMCGDLIVQSSRCIENYLIEFYPDGAWKEGVGYWAGTMTGFCDMTQTYMNTFGTDFNLKKTAGIDKTGFYPIIGAGSVNPLNYNDGAGSDESGLSTPSTAWLGENFNNNLTAFRLSDIVNKGYITNKSLTNYAIDDLVYLNVNNIGKTDSVPLDGYLRGDELVSLREGWNKNSTWVGAQAGANLLSGYHSHIDAGGFEIDMLGERFATEVGVPGYDTKGSTDLAVGRWKQYGRRAEGHNCLIIDPDNGPGQELDSDDYVEKVVSDKKGAYTIMNLSTAYSKKASSVRRGLMLGDDRRSVTVRDEIKLLKSDSEIYWFMHIKDSDIQIINNNEAIITKNGKKVKLTFVTNANDVQLSVMEAVHLLPETIPDDQEKNLSSYKKIAIKMKGGKDIYVQVKMIPIYDPSADNPIENLALDNWYIPEGDLIPLPTANSINTDGSIIDKFKPDVNEYTINVPFGAKTTPAITAECDDDKYIEITQNVNDFESPAVVKVYDRDNPKFMSTYNIYFKIDMSNIAQYRYMPTNVIASAVPQADNPPSNVFDNNIGTRWAADGDGIWIVTDLGEVKDVDYIGTSFMNGASRKAKYDLLVSVDNENWENVFSGEASGTTEDIELMPLYKNVRYIKLVGHGSNTGTWTSVTELGAYHMK